MGEETRQAIEALLFASEKPLSMDEIRQAFSAEGGSTSGGEKSITAQEIRSALEALKNDYVVQNRGFKLFEIAGGYQLVSDPRFASYLKRFYQARETKRLSQASLETLSVVAYRQPVTRADIEFIRGVNVEGALKTLLEKGLIHIVGRKEMPGRPMLYATTREFLEHFGLSGLEELPALAEFTEKDIDPNLLPPELKDDRRQITEDREQITEDRIQRSEDR